MEIKRKMNEISQTNKNGNYQTRRGQSTNDVRHFVWAEYILSTFSFPLLKIHLNATSCRRPAHYWRWTDIKVQTDGRTSSDLLPLLPFHLLYRSPCGILVDGLWIRQHSDGRTDINLLSITHFFSFKMR